MTTTVEAIRARATEILDPTGGTPTGNGTPEYFGRIWIVDGERWGYSLGADCMYPLDREMTNDELNAALAGHTDLDTDDDMIPRSATTRRVVTAHDPDEGTGL